jgi:poly-gamma-glutamate synthesis protein (capsule biosynthesis protein)
MKTNKKFTKIGLLLAVFVCLTFPVKAQIKLVFAGDIMGHMPQISAAKCPDDSLCNYDFSPCYQFLKPYIDSADFAIVNLETTLAGEPYSGYPQFSSPDEALYAPLNAGFDLFLLANNHIADRGKKGLNRSVEIVQNNTKFAGAYIDSIQRDSLYPPVIQLFHEWQSFQVPVKIAFLNYTYGTNGIVLPSPAIVNYIDTNQIKIDIQKISNQYDMLICCIHWGIEYQNAANKEQQNLAQWLANKGVDIIIGSHPHVVQNFDILYRNKDTNYPVPVYYSLGNMISNQRDRYKNGGIFAEIEIDPYTKRITHCDYSPFYVHKGNLFGKYQYYLIPTENFKNCFYQLNETDEEALKLFDSDTKVLLKNLPTKL